MICSYLSEDSNMQSISNIAILSKIQDLTPLTLMIFVIMTIVK
jgi:hypothetical protein